MRSIVVSACGMLLAGLVATTAQAQLASPHDFSGRYVMRGKGLQAADTAYNGTCTVTRDKTHYQVSCFNSDTRHTYVGKGIANGDTFAIMIGDLLRGDHNSNYLGEYLVVYRRRGDGVLEGIWVHGETPAVGSETLTPGG